MSTPQDLSHQAHLRCVLHELSYHPNAKLANHTTTHIPPPTPQKSPCHSPHHRIKTHHVMQQVSPSQEYPQQSRECIREYISIPTPTEDFLPTLPPQLHSSQDSHNDESSNQQSQQSHEECTDMVSACTNAQLVNLQSNEPLSATSHGSVCIGELVQRLNNAGNDHQLPSSAAHTKITKTTPHHKQTSTNDITHPRSRFNNSDQKDIHYDSKSDDNRDEITIFKHIPHHGVISKLSPLKIPNTITITPNTTEIQPDTKFKILPTLPFFTVISLGIVFAIAFTAFFVKLPTILPVPHTNDFSLTCRDLGDILKYNNNNFYPTPEDVINHFKELTARAVVKVDNEEDDNALKRDPNTQNDLLMKQIHMALLSLYHLQHKVLMEYLHPMYNMLYTLYCVIMATFIGLASYLSIVIYHKLVKKSTNSQKVQ